MEKGGKNSVLLKDNPRGWVDSAAINSVKGAHLCPFYTLVIF